MKNQIFRLSAIHAMIRRASRYLVVFVGTFSLVMNVNAADLPVLNNIESGNVAITQGANSTIINQASDKAILNWNSFNIGADKSVAFQQIPGGIALNRIDGAQGASQIYGQLTATGSIILVNPAGIYFGPNSVVNVGNLIASTANIASNDFLNGVFNFVGNSVGSIINAGTIIAAQHGLVALVGGNVSNAGYIQADLGQVVLSSGNTPVVSFGDKLINFSITPSNGVSSVVSNTGSLIADGGRILISAQNAQSVLDNAINLQGVVQAQSVSSKNGEIIIGGPTNGGVVNVAANINASGLGTGQTGGSVTITGYNLNLNDGTTIDASGDIGGGNIFIGGNAYGAGDLPNAKATSVADAVLLAADARSSGNGGNIIVWSDGDTKVHGTISARGGLMGTGGFVETSGHYLDITGTFVDTRATLGNTGMWLLDPTDVIINNATDTNLALSAGNIYQPADGSLATTILTSSTLIAALNSSNITVTTTPASGTGGTGNGDILVNADLTWTSANTLTLNADRDINFSQDVTAINGGLIATAGGDLTVGSTKTFTFGANSSLTAGSNLGLFGNINTTAGLNLTAGGTLVLNGNLALGAASTFTGRFIIAANPITTTAALNFVGSDATAANNTFSSSLSDNLTFNASGNNLGTISGLSAATGTTSYSNIGNLVGGSGNDTFVFGPSYQGGVSIDGGLGNNTLNYTNFGNFIVLAITSPASANGFNGTVSGLNNGFSNINQITGSGGIYSNNNQITGRTSGTSVWNISGPNSGTYVSGGKTLTFTNFGGLTSGGGTNTFAFTNGSTIRSINSQIAGQPAGTLDFSNYGNAVAVRIINDGADNVGYFGEVAGVGGLPDPIYAYYYGIRTFIADASAQSSLTAGAYQMLNWNISGVNSGTITGNSLPATFSNFPTIIYNGVDAIAINLLAGGSITGSFDGGGVAGTTLYAPNVANVWNITGANAGNLTNFNSFTNVSDVVGGNAGNTFNFLDGGSLSGTLRGSSAAPTSNINSLTFNNMTTPVAITLEDNLIDGSVVDQSSNPIVTYQNINSLVADASLNEVINLPSMGNNINIPSAQMGSIANTLSWNGFTTFNMSASGTDVISFPSNTTFDQANYRATINGTDMFFYNYTFPTPTPPAPTPEPSTPSNVSSIVSQPTSNQDQYGTQYINLQITNQTVDNLVQDISKSYDTDTNTIVINPFCSSV